MSGDEARYQHYRDLRTGVLVDGFHFSKAKNDWTFKATAAHVGYRDQKYTGEVDKAGKLVMTFSWDQIPLFYGSIDSDQFGLLTASPYTVASPGVFRLPDSLQTAVQAKPSVLNSAIASAAQGVEIRQLRKTADFAVIYHATSSTDLLFHLVNTMKSGEQPWAATFGFSNAIELPGPLDHRTTDITGQVQWNTERGTIRAGYDGSFFSNNVPSLVWDNPLRATDGASGVGPSQGREFALAGQLDQRRVGDNGVESRQADQGLRQPVVFEMEPGRHPSAVHDQHGASGLSARAVDR